MYLKFAFQYHENLLEANIIYWQNVFSCTYVFCHSDSHIDLVIVNVSVSSDKVSREKKEVTNILIYCRDIFQHLEPFCMNMFKGQVWG